MIGPLSRSGPVLRAFTRSAALRRSVGLVGVVVALLAFTFTFSMAFTKSADQRVAWDLGKAEASARGWRSVDIGHGPTAAEARALSTRRAYGWLGLEGLFDDSAGDPVAYQEGPWADRPFPQRDTLVEGRWPTRPGEVAAATGLGVGPGDRFVLDNKDSICRQWHSPQPHPHLPRRCASDHTPFVRHARRFEERRFLAIGTSLALAQAAHGAHFDHGVCAVKAVAVDNFACVRS